jgi:hypothetical protein
VLFPVVDEYLQYGELQFWLIRFAGEAADSSANDIGEACIYVAVTNNSFSLLRVYWDEETLSFRKEAAFNPSKQQYVWHSYKYSTPDPSYIQTER